MSFTDRSTAASTAYAYTVTAIDSAANTSAASTAGNVTTLAGEGPPPDTIAPSVPNGLATTTVSDRQINLAWTASTDDSEWRVVLLQVPENRCFVRLRMSIDSRPRPTPTSSWSTQCPFLV
jgi:hypothetical protein